MPSPQEIIGSNSYWTLGTPQSSLRVAQICIAFQVWSSWLRSPSHVHPHRTPLFAPSLSCQPIISQAVHCRSCCPRLSKGAGCYRRREEDDLWLDSDLSLLESLCCLPERGTWRSGGPITVSGASTPCCVFTNPRRTPSTLSLFQKHWRDSHSNLTTISLLEAACLRAWEARQGGRTALLSSS